MTDHASAAQRLFDMHRRGEGQYPAILRTRALEDAEEFGRGFGRKWCFQCGGDCRGHDRMSPFYRMVTGEDFEDDGGKPPAFAFVGPHDSPTGGREHRIDGRACWCFPGAIHPVGR